MSFVDEIKMDPVGWRNRALAEPADELPGVRALPMSIADAESLEETVSGRMSQRDELLFQNGSAGLGSIGASTASIEPAGSSRTVGGRSGNSKRNQELGTERAFGSRS